MTPTTRRIGLVALAVLLGANPRGADAAVPAKCPLATAPALHQLLGGNCCAEPAQGVACGSLPGPGAPGAPTPRKSILLVIADDNSYCHWGFMGGLCSNTPVPGGDLADCRFGTPGVALCDPGQVCAFGKCILPCDSNLGCKVSGGSGLCLSSDEFKASHPAAKVPLRLNDPACRNRQPRRPANSTASSNCDVPLNDATEFSFLRSEAPCKKTTQAADPHVLTPYLDELTNRGAVFPRAHVPGNSCKPTRATLLFGKENRHMHFLATVPSKACDANGGTYSGIPCELDKLVKTLEPTNVNGYQSYLWLKGEVASETQAGFDAGKHGTNGGPGGLTIDCIHGGGTGSCSDRIDHQLLPTDANGVAVSGIEKDVFGSIEKDLIKLNSSTATDNPRLTKPFFIWYAPNIPHEGGGAPDYFLNLYAGQPEKATQTFLARVSLFDEGLGALLDGLKRRCVCGPTGHPVSLLDNTVVIFVTDNGFFMPDAKGRAMDNENTQRLPIIISDPGHRGAFDVASSVTTTTIAPSVWPNEFANGIDVLATARGYAAEPNVACDAVSDPDPTYPFKRNLCSWVRGTAGGASIRTVQYGHSADKPFEDSGNDSHYMITRPQLLGVCDGSWTAPIANPPSATALPHARPCRVGAPAGYCGTGVACNAPVAGHFGGTCAGTSTVCMRDADCAPGVTCGSSVAVGSRGGRCINRPDVACAIDRDCAGAVAADPSRGLPSHPALCGGGSCIYDAGSSYADFGPGSTIPGADVERKTCTSNEGCVPRGVCAPVVLKILREKPTVKNATFAITRAYDLNWDPDERTNLLADPDYLTGPGGGTTLKDEAFSCLTGFWGTVDASGHWSQTITSCPWAY